MCFPACVAQVADRIGVQCAVGLPIATAVKPMPMAHAEASVFSSEVSMTQRSRFSRQTSPAQQIAVD